MEILIELLKENLITVIAYVVMALVALIWKKQLSPAMMSRIKGVASDVQALIIDIIAEIASNHEKVNSKLKSPVTFIDGVSKNDLKLEIAVQALKEVKFNKDLVDNEKHKKAIKKLEKTINAVGGYTELIEKVYKAGRLIFKALKK